MHISLSEHFSYRKLLRFTFPSIIMVTFTSVYGVVDGLFVSNFVGKTPFAAINLIWPFLMILGCGGFMIGTGGSALVSKTMGEGDGERANRYFSLLVLFTVALGVAITIPGFFLIEPVALLLGADKAWACDIDPAAEKIVGENSALNNISADELPTLVGDITLDGAVRRSLFSRQYNIILSNIVADVLIALCPHIPALLAPGAVWVTSGIIDTRLSDVETAFTAAGLRIREVKTAKGWCCVICEK